MLAGHVGEDAVLVARRGDQYFASGATCSHSSGPLAEGLLVGDTVRCPWHHACFSLRTGESVEAPAFNSVGCWCVELRDGKIFVREKIEPAPAIEVSGPLASAVANTSVVGVPACVSVNAQLR